MSSKRTAVLLSVLLTAALLVPTSFVPAAVRGAPVRSQGAIVRDQSAFPAEAVPPSPADSLTTEADAAALTQGDWWTAVQEDISRSEYNVTPLTGTGWQEQTDLPDPPTPSSGGTTADENVPQAAGLRVGGGEPQSSGLRYSPASGASAYQAPNRAHNLRTTFTGDGITIVPRTEVTPTWSLSLALAGYGEAQPTVSGNRVEYARGAITEWYVNDERGLEQGFVLAEPPAADVSGLVQLDLAVSGSLLPKLVSDSQSVEFATYDGAPVLRYGDLNATDAADKALRVYCELLASREAGLPTADLGSDGQNRDPQATIRIVVDAVGATYPITIEPLLTSLQAPAAPAALSPTPNWMVEGGQADSRFGHPVATAGDVNGDGYSDVIVGAPQYDAGELDEGRAFVYQGSSAGLSLTPSWIAESNQAGARFGYSVSTAGDVNGDGYADVIVGAYSYDAAGTTDAGRAYIYYGAASGLSTSPNWTATGDQAGDQFGGAVNTAGDINGDGYADIVVGANLYDNGETDEGRAYAYYGSPSGPSLTPAWIAEGDRAGAYFGSYLGTAGDVNGDGYADVVIGAWGYDRVFVYFGSASGLSDTPNWIGAGQSGSYFGFVSTAGDVNGDGYADIIVGADRYTGANYQEGRAYVYYGSASGPSAAPNWTVSGGQWGASLGHGVSTAGDVNGDGYADVIVGAHAYDNDQTNEGRAWVYYGSASGLGATPAWTAESNNVDSWFGYRVSTAGDVNGDGYADVIVGADRSTNVEAHEGAAFVYHGGPDGLSATADWTAEGNQEGANFGHSVGTAGDVNGDGYADVIVGAYLYDGGRADTGRASVYLGSASGLGATPAWTADGDASGRHFGFSVATAGDVNGDGYSDIIIGAKDPDVSQMDAGRAFVYLGSASGLAHAPVWTTQGDQPGAGLGKVATAGDVNGDGYADIVVGALEQEVGPGHVYLFLGSPGGPAAAPSWAGTSGQYGSRYGLAVASAGDVNGDGYGDLVVGADRYSDGQFWEGAVFVYFGSATGLGATASWTAQGNAERVLMGYSVGSAGDVNGDGYADLIVGVPLSPYPSGEGQAQVYLGSATGLPAAPAWVVNGDQVLGQFGVRVDTAGDVNGDGYADVIVATNRYDNGQIDEGRVYVYPGSASGPVTASPWIAESDQAYAYLGFGVGTAGDVDGDGYADLITGAYGYDNNQTEEGAAFVYYGNRSGLSLRPQQRRSDNSAPIAHLGMSDQPDRFRLALLGRTPFGRGHVKLEWEVKPRSVPFDGAGLQRSAAWVDTGTAGAQLDELTGGLSAGTLYHWRVRLLYHPATTPFQQYSRWLTNPWNGWNEARLRTAAGAPPTPTPTATPTATLTPTATPTATPAHGRIRGVAWYDHDGNGARGAGEPGLTNISIRLFAGGLQVGQTVTLGDGTYRFPALRAGRYTVRERQPAWLRWSTTPNEVTVDVPGGQQVEVDFGDWSGRPVWLPLVLR